MALRRLSSPILRLVRIQGVRHFGAGPKKIPITTPGADPDLFGDYTLQGHGDEAAEVGFIQERKVPLYHEGPIIGPFGTIEKPTVLYSHLERRMVGCHGGGELEHETLWMAIKQGPKHVCVECGQVFQLKKHLLEYGDIQDYEPVKELVEKREKVSDGHGSSHGSSHESKKSHATSHH
eukprot:TRINITY_DN1952_c0_g1_i1.p1 TRINITY_DN1952_c0_g1~~TRINITY_DN1952_c0_g1_i1.p1  ORF type:complete len:178 (-),score=12.26 TRINITY_DN1952_c0_g1_i1:131-664(-)